MNHVTVLKKISLLGVLGLGLLVMAPNSAQAVDAPATLHVIVNVINDDAGTAVASDFTMHIRYLMKEVTGSPFPGASGAGTTFTLPAGSYLITENDVPISGGYVTYYGHYSEGGTVDGFVTLAAGQSLTITRTENDWPAAGPAVVQPTASPIPATPTSTSAPVTPTTQVGGTLPTTASPWYNMLAISLGLVLMGGFALRVRKAVK
ncbi:MAG TPA: hypothetical protein VF307_07245 [Candidatus Nanopelagicaceae bacterium]